jgi:hypothetical protein
MHLVWPWVGFVAYGVAVIFTMPDPVGPTPDWIRGGHMFLMILGLLLLLPVTILTTRDLWHDRRDLGRDLREDRVERFEPVVTGTLADVEGAIEVRHPSGRLISGIERDLGDLAPIREVAPGPIIGMRVRHPAEGLPEGARLERRHLSPEERDELARTVARIERIPAIEYVGLLWCVICVWSWLAAPGSAKSPSSYLVLAQGLFCGGWFAWTLIRSHMLAHRMRADVQDGFALVFVPPEPNAQAEEEGLPHSGLTWRIAGMPAEWRGAKQLDGSSL